MYEHLRASLQASLQTRVDEQTRTHQVAQQARVAVDAANVAFGAAQQALAASTAAAQGSQTTLNAAQTAQQARQNAYDAAASALATWDDNEPEPDLPNGKPNPAHLAWLRRRNELDAAAKAAADALNSAKAQTAAASAALAAANAQVSARQNDASARAQDLAIATVTMNQANAQENQAAAAIAALQQQIADLDVRAAIATADPLNREALNTFADQEQAQVSQLRTQRAQRRADRYTATQQRLAILVAHDATIDALPPFLAQLRGWTNTGYPGPASAAAGLDALIQSARQQRTAPNRADDLPGLTGQLRNVFVNLQSSVDAAARDLVDRQRALDAAILTLATVTKQGPF
jgi:trimeric autotransporter adhesin